MTTSEHLAFPVLAISPGDSFNLIDSLDSLRTATPRGLSHYFPNAHLLDSDGLLWPIVAAVPSHEPTLFDRLLSRRLHVTLRLAQPQSGQLGRVIEWLVALLTDRSHGDLYNQFVEVETTIERLHSAVSPPDVFRIVRACLQGSPEVSD